MLCPWYLPPGMGALNNQVILDTAYVMTKSIQFQEGIDRPYRLQGSELLTGSYLGACRGPISRLEIRLNGKASTWYVFG